MSPDKRQPRSNSCGSRFGSDRSGFLKYERSSKPCCWQPWPPCRLSITRNPDIFDTTRTRNAVSVRAAIEAQYFAVLPGLDLSVPVGFGYGLSGHSSINQSQNDRVGDISVGIRAVYRAVWEGSIMLTHFVGPPSRQPYADRDFISISIQRTF